MTTASEATQAEESLWRRLCMPVVPAERLAALRILSGAFVWIYLIARLLYFARYTRLTAAQFRPVGVVTLLDQPLPATVTWALALAALPLGLAFVLGWRFRLTGPLFAALALWLTSYRSSWGMIFHTENLMVLHLCVLALAPAAAAWSLDARRLQQPTPASETYGWPIRLMCAITVVGYVLAGVAKLRHTGMAWVTTDFLRNYVAYDALRKIELGGAHSPIGAALASEAWLFKPLAAFSLLVELLAPVALLWRRAARVWVVCVIAFHAGVLALMAILFPYPLFGIGLASFLMPEKWLQRLHRAWRERKAAATRHTASLLVLMTAASALCLGCDKPTRPAGAAGSQGRTLAPTPPTPPTAPSTTTSAATASSTRAAGERPHPGGFLKGQLHLHSGRSGDSETPPADVVRWYDEQRFDFIVFTDHNWITKTAGTPDMLVLQGVELTQNLRRCDPPPLPGHACLLHVDALCVTPTEGRATPFGPQTSLARTDLYGRALEWNVQLGGIAQLNHPNFHFAADINVVMALVKRGLTHMEIANEAVDSANNGDRSHPSTEQLWDAALTRGARLFGTATDDAHHYYDAAAIRARGEIAYVGNRGWVMVRSAKDPAAIRAALAAGDFYSSTGVLLERLLLTPQRIELHVATGRDPIRIEVIGQNGKILQQQTGRSLDFATADKPSSYWRVRIIDADGRRAWSQPVWPKAAPSR